MATEYLQAIDAGGTVVNGGQGLVERINQRAPGAQARIDETFATAVGYQAREAGTTDATGYIIAYDGSSVRNTTVNNIAYGAGFISNSTDARQLELERAARARRTAATPGAAGTGNS